MKHKCCSDGLLHFGFDAAGESRNALINKSTARTGPTLSKAWHRQIVGPARRDNRYDSGSLVALSTEKHENAASPSVAGSPADPPASSAKKISASTDTD